jgi:hypothetical protein
MIRRGRAFFLVGILAVLAGCTSQSSVFKDRSPEQVWTALIAVAEDPQYDKWVVVENNVWVDMVYDRLEIQRTLKRDLHRTGSSPKRETQDLELQVVLERTQPPAVTVTVRNAIIRGKAIMAIDHFFGEVRDLLGIEEESIQTADAGD